MFEILTEPTDYKEDEKFLDDDNVTKIDDINVRNENFRKIDEDIVNLRGLIDQFKEDLKETKKETVDHSKEINPALTKFYQNKLD